ncbi:V-snare-domain-containing protein [Xylariaceae sp. FL1019]|nr:V-snare-domain-containing protein [Xylariaceae sp. FL1019]
MTCVVYNCASNSILQGLQNTQFNSALKQSTSIKRDLATLSSTRDSGAAPTPAALGSLSASLTAFSRTIEEYSSLTQQELNPAKADKAQERLRNFRAELSEFRGQLEAFKNDRENTIQSQSHSELSGRRPFTTSTPENPYANASTSAPTQRYGGQQMEMGREYDEREAHAVRERDFFATTNDTLDEYLSRGSAVLSDLGMQRETLKNTQAKLYSVANTLGVSGSTIRMVERRAKEDKWIFLGGIVVFFVFCWLVLHFLR